MAISPTILAYTFCAFIAVVVLFHLALALGAPWGEMAMGGKYPGRYPTKMRIATLVQIVLFILIALVVLTRAGLVFENYFIPSKSVILFIVAYLAVGTILNIITPSKKERILWAPVTTVLLVCSFLVAKS